MYKRICYTAAFFLAVGASFVAPRAYAATLSLVPSANTIHRGDTVTVFVRVDTGSTSSTINAVQAVVHFPADKLQALSVDTNGSALSFWLDGPTISNTDGTVRFLGGQTGGISGGSLKVLAISFKAIGSGTADITATDVSVAANDGSGTNVIDAIRGTTIGIDATVSVGTAVEQPSPVTRTPVPATVQPGTPHLRLPLYPDQTHWYNQIGNAIVLWDVPPDVTQVSAVVGQSKSTGVPKPEPELLTGKNFGLLTDGVWYVRVQFKNSLGWGPVAYYKISLDTTAPLPFKVGIDNALSDNPTPKISYSTIDNLSGIDSYLVSVDGGTPIHTASTSLILPPQGPGKHTLTVQALDVAGNSISESQPFEIIPLPMPVVNFNSASVSQGEPIFASGKTLPGQTIDVNFITSDKQKVFTTNIIPDEIGNWNITIPDPFPIGKYYLTFVARDSRGAQSYPTDQATVQIKEKIILSLGFISLGWYEIAIILALLALSAGSIIFWRLAVIKHRRESYGMLVQRDVQKMTALLAEDIEDIEKVYRKQPMSDKSLKTDMTSAFKKMKDTLAKLKQYVGEEVEELKG